MKAKLITRKEGNNISGPYSIIQQIRYYLEASDIPIGYLHSVHNIEFEDEKIYQYKDQGETLQAESYLLTLDFGNDVLRALCLFIGGATLLVYSHTKEKSELTDEYQKRKDMFLKLPNEQKLIKFILSLPQVKYE